MVFIQIGSVVQSKLNPSWHGIVVEIKRANGSALISWEADPEPITSWCYVENIVPATRRLDF